MSDWPVEGFGKESVDENIEDCNSWKFQILISNTDISSWYDWR